MTKTSRIRTRVPGTRKFGRRRFVLKWDSSTFRIYHDPDSAKGVAEKKHMAKVWAGDYNDSDWESRITTYRNGKDFKVWALPR